MNSTEMSGDFQSGVVWAHHLCESIFFVVNVIVCWLILFDHDHRGRSYRKYLFSLQFNASIADTLLTLYSPFIQFNCHVMYSDSFFADHVGIVNAASIYFIFIAELGASYISCVYFRKSMLLPRCYHGRKYVAVLVVIQAYALFAAHCAHWFLSSFRTYSKDIPESILWIKQKSAFIIVDKETIDFTSLNFLLAACFGGMCTMYIMATELLVGIKHGMASASPATRIYQTRLVFSILMQGVVPSVTYLTPIIVFLVIIFTSPPIGQEATSSRKMSILCVISANLLNLHAFVHSLTVLACSPSYRKTIALQVARIRNAVRTKVCGIVIIAGRTGTVEPHSNSQIIVLQNQRSSN